VVLGTWSGGASGAASCTTTSNGTCSVTRTKVAGASATFSVTSVSLSGSSYAAAANHDPDGSSNGTTITVQSPV
jgi:hypothetical protein